MGRVETSREVQDLKPKHGGKREGAGSPRLEQEPQLKRTVMLSQRVVDKAKKIGDGNMSEGLRKAVDGFGVGIALTGGNQPVEKRTTLPDDVARCVGYGSDTAGWRDGCEHCLRRTAPAANDRPVNMVPPGIVVFECEFLIET